MAKKVHKPRPDTEASREATAIAIAAGIQRRQKALDDRAALEARWSHKQEGTPETHERIAIVPERRRQSALSRMVKLGKITADELAAAQQIAQVVEMIERGVSVRSASLEARVDNSGSSRDALVESLGRIRAEVAYRAWREAIPMPRRMIIDLIVTDVSYVRLAKSYNLHWQTARKRLITALRMWPSFQIQARQSVTKDTVHEVYSKLGDGVLLQPKPRVDQPKDRD